jgi:osmotically-inducible protein OsmY
MKTDSEIQNDVMDELKWEPFLQSSEIGVSVKSGVVTLSGTVNSYLKKSRAEKAAKRVAGVKAVAEDIEVKYTSDFIKNDTEIAEAVLNALKWHSAIQEEKIKVKVENGVVTLDGEVDWEFQRNSAVLQIENLIGVKRIINNIRIKTSLPLKELKQKISSAFHRSATLDSDKIRIETNGSKVTLNGKVRSWAEKNDAENAVWAAPGVTKVENLLEIESKVFAL